jgi:poly-gamma-glutamate synthesis protein (capsule biosynthesis protein)
MINQEFPFSLRGSKMEDKQFTFRTDPKYVKIFNDMGIDIVSLANNHTLDYGVDALVDSFDVLEQASIQYGGAGNNLEEAKEVKYIDVKNKKISFVCASRVIPVTEWAATSDREGLFTTYDPSAMIEKIKEADESSDFVVAYVHWGLEHKEMPEEYQRTMGKQYIDAGADIVIGCHTHCLQGAEQYKDKLIIYSLGNFMFGGNIDRTMMVRVLLENDVMKTQLLPCKAKSYCTSLVTEDSNRQDFYKYYKEISFDIDIDEDGFIN